ncbi:zinc finger protein 300-like [Anopheles bellator]|uniref:zinc finger protein 300-like n=1 Tax=Anopheles bellator TaxID=139047 RepID=UPI0026477B4A|nr:zinc finger protein 300-like [Anopheles bellator]
MSQNCCRICLGTNPRPESFQSLFSTHQERFLATLFTELCGIVVEVNDDSPKMVCKTCVESLGQAHELRQRCIDSDKLLRQIAARKQKEANPKQTDDRANDEDAMDAFSRNMYTVGAHSVMLLGGNGGVDGGSMPDYNPEATSLAQEQRLPKGFVELLNSTSARPRVSETAQGCCGCELSFQTEAALQEHSLVAHYSERIVCDARPYECPVCYKRFVDGPSLAVHGLSRTLCYRCRYCEKRFNDRRQLQLHEKYHRRKYVSVSAEQTASECGICGQSFRCRASLKAHIRRLHTTEPHAEQLIYKCGQCERRFARRTHLRSHEISHSDATPHGCGVCGLKFKRKQHLVAHRKIHDGTERTYKCRHCGAGFVHQSTRAYHEISKHTGAYPFSCWVCGKHFFRKPMFDKHMARHGQE